MSCFCRRHDDAQFLHDVEWLPVNTSGRFELDRHECMGRSLYVFHICKSSRVRVRQLCGTEEATS